MVRTKNTGTENGQGTKEQKNSIRGLINKCRDLSDAQTFRTFFKTSENV